MNCTTRCLTKWATAVFAVTVALACSPASRAEDQPAAAQPTSATTPATASQPAAATPQPTADQRLEELEKEVTLLQEQIAAMKSDSTPGMKTAALTEPAAGGSSFAPSPADDAPAKISIASLLGPITLSGFGDVYYGYDYNHPVNNLAGLRSFEAPTNGFNFNMAELILDKAPDATSAESRIGYHISAGYGYAARVIDGSDNTGFSSTPGYGANFYLKEAYVSYLAPVGKGLTVTVGKFVTPIGAEVIESNANWNYSRGLLFNYAIPFFHFGASAKYAFNPKWAFTAYLVNGWNNTVINHAPLNVNGDSITGTSTGLTYGGSLAYTPNAKWSVIENYFAGPVLGAFSDFTGASISDWKQLSDTVISYTPNSKWAFMLNGDYGFGPRFYSECDDDAIVRPSVIFTCNEPSKASTWWGVAGYAKYTLSPKTNFAVRYEYFDDPQGYVGLLTNTGLSEINGGSYGPGFAQEVTGTYSYNLTSALLIRGEYRYDFASQPIFAQAISSPKNDGLGAVKAQNTATISFVYSFSSANMK
jgi:Putative beta-barrel porin-2, OmpL-like. bbp2